MNKNLPKIEVGFDRGFPFVMAFVYTKQGTVIYAGSLNRVQEATKRLDTCHAFILSFPRKCKALKEAFPGVKPRFLDRHRDHYYTLLGKLTNFPDWESRFYCYYTLRSYRGLDLIDPVKEAMRPQFAYMANYLDKRKKWFLCVHWKTQDGQKGDRVLGTWRKLPRSYLRELEKEGVK
jgi:hypothetical protein